jgi:hypothetical protein
MDSRHVRQTPADDEFRRWFIKWVSKLKEKAA